MMILSLKIEGEWTARNLANVLNDLDRFAHFVETGVVEDNGFKLQFTGSGFHLGDLPREDYLRVVRLEYNSPGEIDLLGIGKVVEQIRLFLQFLIKEYMSRNDRHLDRAERQIEIVGRLVDLLKKDPDLHSDLVSLVEKKGADALIEAVFSRRITSVSVKDLDKNT